MDLRILPNSTTFVLDQTLQTMALPDDKAQSRRRFLSSLLKTGMSLPELWAKQKISAAAGVPAEAVRKTAVSPPGSLSHKHLNETCDGCQKCIASCPTKVLRPCTSEYDMAAIMQPVMDFTRGYCESDCTVCSEVCPNGAITRIDSSEKQDIVIGRAVLTRSLCVNNTAEVSCTRCEDACPFSAIRLKEDYNMGMVGDDQHRHFPKFPVIESALCIGCGKCEYVCPSQYARAIHVEGLEVHETD